MVRVIRTLNQFRLTRLGDGKSFLANVSKLLAGNMTAQALVLACTPIITRLFKPTDYGVMVLVGSVVSVCSIFSCMRYDTAIIIEKDDGKSVHLLFLCFMISTIVTLASVLVYFGLAYSGAELVVGVSSYAAFFILAGIFSMGFNNSLRSLMIRGKLYDTLAKMIVASSLLTIATKVVGGYLLGSNTYVLLSANLFGVLLAILIMFLALYRKGTLTGIRQFNLADSLNVAREHVEFPKYQVVNNLLNAMSQNAVVLLMSVFFTPQVIGLYGLSRSVLQKPILLVGNSFKNAYLQNVSEFQEDRAALSRSMLKATTAFALIGLMPFGALLLFGEQLFAFVFGETWREAGIYSQIMAPWLFMVFINNPANQMIILLKKLRFNFLYNVSTLIMRLVVIIVLAILYSSAEIVVLGFSLVGTVINIYYIYMAYRFTQEPEMRGA